jgi:hypothetical protein
VSGQAVYGAEELLTQRVSARSGCLDLREISVAIDELYRAGFYARQYGGGMCMASVDIPGCAVRMTGKEGQYSGTSVYHDFARRPCVSRRS